MIHPLERRVLLDATLDPMTGLLVVNGSAGNDTILITMSGTDVVVNIQPENFVQSFPEADVNFIGIDALAGNDVISLASDVTKSTFIDGGDGNDTITGGGGSDNIHGSAGNDFIFASPGADSIAGDQGIDSLSYAMRTANLSIIVDGGDVSGEPGEMDNIDSSIERIFGGSGNDLISFEGISGDRVVYGHNGNDTLIGGTGNDRLHGGPGDDEVNGMEGNDTLLGTHGKNVLDGGDGNDTVTYYWAGSAVFAEANGQPVSATARQQDTINANVENLVGSAFDDVLVGNDSDNQLEGLAGNDTITAGGGNNTLLGGPGNDFFFAQNGNADTVDGGDGDDDGLFDEIDTLMNIT